MPKYYAIQLVPSNSGFGEWDRSLYGGDYDRTIKGAIAKAIGAIDGEYNPIYHDHYLLGRDEIPEIDMDYWGEPKAVKDIRGLIHDEPERVYVVEDEYGIRYVGVEVIK